MKPRGDNPDETKLASRFTVADYKKAHAKRDRDAIAEAIRRRFTERYISPVGKARLYNYGDFLPDDRSSRIVPAGLEKH
jgi:hypothetical protein